MQCIILRGITSFFTFPISENLVVIHTPERKPRYQTKTMNASAQAMHIALCEAFVPKADMANEASGSSRRPFFCGKSNVAISQVAPLECPRRWLAEPANQMSVPKEMPMYLPETDMTGESSGSWGGKLPNHTRFFWRSMIPVWGMN